MADAMTRILSSTPRPLTNRPTWERSYRVVRALPDAEPVEFDKPRCVYASWPWLTEELMREVEGG
ncbi:hypothetical protein [Streptomyces asiaticus]|uniref:hypothetical protein n=1 Tax=Streptomyces asiaticus TaxID=114695 RepID=UPI001BA605F6|nr:hypothetical protein [Streptomyces asiaticus]